MRIIHLSDIHLSNENIEDLRLHYRSSLVTELKSINEETEIDLIIISGDLVDKGGSSLNQIEGYENVKNPYDVFEKEFLDIVSKEIPFQKHKILFIAGNHDIQQNKIDKVKEAGMKSILRDSKETNDLCREYEDNKDGLNIDRMQDYLDFEEQYHKNNSLLTYEFSTFESKVLYERAEQSIGIALINDSWRCGKGKVENHFMDANQLYRCLCFFEKSKTIFNIAVIHHPLDCFNKDEKEKIENIFHSSNFHLVLLGHEHSQKFEEISRGIPNSKIIYIRGRSAFDKPHEREEDYISGFTIIDIDFTEKKLKCKYKKYDKTSFTFVDDMQGGSCTRECSYGFSDVIKNSIEDKNKNDFELPFDKNNFITK